jgi:hypothetical protein
MEVCYRTAPYIHEKEKKTPKNIQKLVIPEKFSKTEEYDLKRNFFDPNKSSPPNEFMIKLYKRFYHANETDSMDVGGDIGDSETFLTIFNKK